MGARVAEEKESSLLREVLHPSIWGIALFLTITANLLLVALDNVFARFCYGWTDSMIAAVVGDVVTGGAAAVGGAEAVAGEPAAATGGATAVAGGATAADGETDARGGGAGEYH
jgi:hypothetical protein